MGKLRTALTVLLAAAAFPAAATAADDALSGTYEGQGPGLKASVVLDESGDGTLSYALKTQCGKTKDTIDLEGGPGGTLKGSQSSKKSSLIAKLKPDRGTPSLSGSLKYSNVVKDRDAKGKTEARSCRAKQNVSVKLDVSSSPEIEDLSGHYAGTGDEGGLPISFDVSFDQAAGALQVNNLGFQTDTECYNDLDEDGEDDTLVAQISGLESEVDSDGAFEIDYAPDDDTEFYVEGYLEDGQAELYLEVGGYFAADGTPQAGGPYECDSWGEDYTASR